MYVSFIDGQLGIWRKVFSTWNVLNANNSRKLTNVNSYVSGAFCNCCVEVSGYTGSRNFCLWAHIKDDSKGFAGNVKDI